MASEEEEVLAELENAGVLAGLRWVGRAAQARVLRDHGGEAAYDQTWLGLTSHVLFCDRMDRVFGCGQYDASQLESATDGADLLIEGLTQYELEAMPRLDSGIVRYSPLNGSPGWRFGEWRWLLNSFKFGDVNSIQWDEKRPTKQQVAKQDPPNVHTQFLPGTADEPEKTEETDPPSITFIAAHSVSFEMRDGELWFGHPRWNPLRENPWHWKSNLYNQPPGRGKTGFDTPTVGPDTLPKTDESVRDAAVTLKRQERSAES